MIIENFLKNEGYKLYPQLVEYPYTKRNLWQKQISNERVCETNEKLFINVLQYQFEEYTEVEHEKFEVYIVAEFHEKWWDIKCYSLSQEEIIYDLHSLESTLIKMFNTI